MHVALLFMNIFILDTDVIKCAQSHCDKHVIKMILEYSQLLSTACHVHGIATDGMYKKTHINHPCAKWVISSKSNFEYLLQLNIALMDEYTYRYGKIHASSRLIPLFESVLHNVPYDISMTPFAIVVKEQTGSNNPIIEYRHLYNTEKHHMCTWKNREIPGWFNE